MKFLVKLRTRTRTARCSSPITVSLTRVAAAQEGRERYAHLTQVTPHDEGTAASAEADAYLHIWELDRFAAKRYLQDEEADPGEPENKLIASFPGVVVRLRNGTYEFRYIGDGTRQGPDSGEFGEVQLDIKPAAGGDATRFIVPFCDYEGVPELAAAVVADENDTALGDSDRIPPFQVRNILAAAAWQIRHRGGFAIAFVRDYRPAGVVSTDVMDIPSNNDREFERQAEDMLDVLPTFCINSDGALDFGFHVIRDRSEMPAIMQRVRDAVKDAVAMRYPDVFEEGDSEPPFITNLVLYAHGWRNGMGIRHVAVGEAHQFAEAIYDHISNQVIVTFFACSCGRAFPSLTGANGHADIGIGRPLIGEELGADSVAWRLEHELRMLGIEHPTVWAHTDARHTTRNPSLRVFSHFGSTDLPNILSQEVRLAQVGPAYYGIFGESNRDRLHRANLVRIISLQSAMYLPLDFLDAEPRTQPDEYDQESADWTSQVITEVQDALPTLPTEAEAYELAADRLFIVGVTTEGQNPPLCEHFRANDFRDPDGNLYISVRLVRAVQLLRRRVRAALSIIEVDRGGDLIKLKRTPVTAAQHQALITHAQNLMDLGMLSQVNSHTDPTAHPPVFQATLRV